jgi:hypothetical protein
MTDSFEKKILKKIFGPTRANVVWRIRYNEAFYSLCDDVALSTFLRLKRLQ